MDNYDQFWKTHSSNDNWRELILPKRTTDEFFNEGKLEAELLNKSGNFDANSTVLEFGCGIGRILKFINIPHENKIAVDVCQVYLDKISEPMRKVKSDGYSIPDINEDSVDFIYSLMVFQHINKRDHISLFSQLFSFLKPGGKMLIQFPRIEDDYYIASDFVNLYTKEEVKAFFNTLNYTDLEITTGNLVAYGEHGKLKSDGNREYFALITK
jgi:cyclopropane fatty-acyl-phospholipid synthase-like methyltransferase